MKKRHAQEFWAMYNAFCGDSTPPSELDIETCNAPVLAQAATHGLGKLHGARRSRHCIVPTRPTRRSKPKLTLCAITPRPAPPTN